MAKYRGETKQFIHDANRIGREGEIKDKIMQELDIKGLRHTL
jgi:hypothetical protein